MPQMAPLLWLYLYFFFLISLMLVLVLNYYIKPFEIMSPISYLQNITQKSWKL